MSNMSYCRFENTAGDFRDCLEALRVMSENQGNEGDQYEENNEQFSDLNDYEKSGLKSLLANCEEFKELAEDLLELNKEGL
jgi:hypothetical protein